jgi:two-component system, cell cycle sensor histidine kinase and response regulator CckA
LKILLIDDNRLVLQVLALMLESDGHTVVPAGNGREGLGRLNAGEAVDVVLTDVVMPDMSGWEVVRIVRSRWPSIRVGLITATSEHPSEQREPVDLLIRKPVTLENLLEAIKSVL